MMKNTALLLTGTLMLALAGCASDAKPGSAAMPNEFREVAPNGDRVVIRYGVGDDGVAFYRLAEQNRGAATAWRLPAPPKSGEFRIFLTSNPTTGYSWECEVAAGKDQITVLEKDFIAPPATDPPRSGAPGEECFRLKLEPNWKSAEIRLRYRRPWEPAEKAANIWRLRLEPTP